MVKLNDILTLKQVGLASGNVLTKYSPLIEYRWSTFTGNGVRYLNDSSSNPKYHAQLYSGQGVNFNGVDQLIPFTPIAQYTIYTFNGVMQYIVGALDVNSILPIGTYQNIIYLDFNLTQAQKDRYVSNPETFLYKDSHGALKSDILSQSEIDNVVAYLPMCETDEYVRDLVGYSEFGLTSSGFNPVGANWDGTTLSYNSSTNDRLDYSVNNEGSIDKTNTYMITRVQVENVSGTPYLRHASSEGGWTAYGTKTLVNGWNYFITHVPTNPGGIYSLLYVGTAGHSLDVLSWEVDIITDGIYPIQNYTNSCRDDAQNLNKGLQTAKWLRDDLGVPYGLSQYLECDGIGYVDTGYNSSSLFTIELIAYINSYTDRNAYESIFGVREATDSNTQNTCATLNYIGDSMRVHMGDKWGQFNITPNSINNYAFVYDGTTLKVYENKILKHTKVTNIVENNESMYIGAERYGTSVRYKTTSPIRLFKVHEKALTQEEIIDNYNKYTTQGLLT